MRRIGILAWAVAAAILLAGVGLSAAGQDLSVIPASLMACFWGAIAVGVVVRLVWAWLTGRPVRKQLQPLTDAAAAYNELLTGTPPAAVQAQRLPSPLGDDRESSSGGRTLPRPPNPPPHPQGTP